MSKNHFISIFWHGVYLPPSYMDNVNKYTVFFLTLPLIIMSGWYWVTNKLLINQFWEAPWLNLDPWIMFECWMPTPSIQILNIFELASIQTLIIFQISILCEYKYKIFVPSNLTQVWPQTFCHAQPTVSWIAAQLGGCTQYS